MTDTTVINPDEPYRMPPPSAVEDWRRSTGLERPSLMERYQNTPPGTRDLPRKLSEEQGAIESEHEQFVKDRAQRTRDLQAEYRRRPAIPNQQQLGPPPDAKDYHKHSGAWLGAMAMLGALGAKSGRMSGTAALSAFSGAMKGWQEGNLQAYNEAAEKWKNENTRTIENNRQLMEKYQMVLDDHRMNIDEKLAEYKRVAIENHDDQGYHLANMNHFTAMAQRQDMLNEWLHGPKGVERTSAILAANHEANVTAQQDMAMKLGPAAEAIRARRMVDPTGQPWTNKNYADADYILQNFGPGTVGWGTRGRGGVSGVRMSPRNEFIQNYMDAHGGQRPTEDEITEWEAGRAGQISAARVTASAEPRADANALTKLTQQQTAIKTWEKTAIANGEKLKQLAQQVDQTGYPAIEGWIRAGRMSSGDPKVAAFNAQMDVYRAEVAKIIANPNLTGQLTDHARKEVENFMAGGASASQIIAVVDLLKQDFGRREKAIEDERQTIIDRLHGKKGDVKEGTTETAGGGSSDPLGIR